MQPKLLEQDNGCGVEERFSLCSRDISVLTQIYDENINIALWQRQLSEAVNHDVANILHTNMHLNVSAYIDAKSIKSDVANTLIKVESGHALVANISELVDMFCILFEQKQIGLRLRLLDSPMCPRFHVDRVPCRLVTTFSGSGSQWLEHECVDRSKLGHGSKGLDDSVSGLFDSPESIRTASAGDVALFKGETWYGNENAGIIHRSPPFVEGQKRLLMTLDFIA